MENKGSFPMANPMLVLREEYDDWAVLFDPDTGNAFGMNPISVLIYKNLDGKTSSDVILKKLSDEFNNVPGTAKDEVESFIADLTERGFAGYELKK